MPQTGVLIEFLVKLTERGRVGETRSGRAGDQDARDNGSNACDGLLRPRGCANIWCSGKFGERPRGPLFPYTSGLPLTVLLRQGWWQRCR